MLAIANISAGALGAQAGFMPTATSLPSFASLSGQTAGLGAGLSGAPAAALTAGSVLGPGGGSAPLPAQAAAPAPFSDLLNDAVGQVNRLEDQARTTVTGLMTGSGVDVHEAMIATEKASMAFELTLAVRNKAVQAYQSVVGMQF
jgi:flagellar hook-basal body complex protein FliE